MLIGIDVFHANSSFTPENEWSGLIDHNFIFVSQYADYTDAIQKYYIYTLKNNTFTLFNFISTCYEPPSIH